MPLHGGMVPVGRDPACAKAVWIPFSGLCPPNRKEIRMSKQEMIEEIRRHNRSADSGFLDSFKEPALERYLRRLTDVHGRRGPGSVWVRDGETPAIVTRASEA